MILLRSFNDLDDVTGLGPVEQLDHIGVAHSATAVGCHLSDVVLVRGSMDVDPAPHAVHITEPILPNFEPTQPKDSSENPVSIGFLPHQLRSADLTGRPAPGKDCTRRRTRTYFRAYFVKSAGRHLATVALTRSLRGGRNGVVGQDLRPFENLETLRTQIYANTSFCHEKNLRLSRHPAIPQADEVTRPPPSRGFAKTARSAAAQSRPSWRNARLEFARA